MSAPPYMNWYPGDYLKDTRALTLEQHGAYHLLLWECWAREGVLPDNDPALARVVGVTPAKWAKLRPEVMAFFVWTPEGWRHRRLSAELDKALAARAKRSAAGKEGVKARWGEGHDKVSRAERLTAARQIARHTAAEWKSLVRACENACVICGIPESQLNGGALCKDHIVPIYAGGSDGIENLQPVCRQCNSGKGSDRTDHRPHDWRKRLANAYQTPSERLASSASASAEEPSQEGVRSHSVVVGIDRARRGFE